MNAPTPRVSGAKRPALTLEDDARVAALVGFTLAAVAVVAVNTRVPDGENGGTGPLIFGILLSGIVALVLGIVAFSRVRRPALGGLVIGTLGLVTVVAFWSGLPFVLGSLGVGLSRRSAGRMALAAQVIGVLAIAVGVLVTVHDQL